MSATRFDEKILKRMRSLVRVHATPLDRFRLVLAQTTKELEDAFTVLHDAYADRGLEERDLKAMRVTPHHLLREAAVILAYEGEKPVGTITVTKDSPAGLPLDKDYPDELAELRDQGCALAEIGSVAVLRSWRHSGVMTLLGMTAAYVSIKVYQASHTVIGVHPKQEVYYQAIYSFQRLGVAKPHAEFDDVVVALVANNTRYRGYASHHFDKPLANGFLPVEQFVDNLAPCVKVPESWRYDPSTWRLSRQVFRRVFVHDTHALRTANSAVATYLRRQRGPDTLRDNTSEMVLFN